MKEGIGMFCGRKGMDVDPMSKKVNLGVPRNKISGKSGSIDKADKRGEGKRII